MSVHTRWVEDRWFWTFWLAGILSYWGGVLLNDAAARGLGTLIFVGLAGTVAWRWGRYLWPRRKLIGRRCSTSDCDLPAVLRWRFKNGDFRSSGYACRVHAHGALQEFRNAVQENEHDADD